MHPEVVMNKPGKCPKCGMTLVKMKPGKKGFKNERRYEGHEDVEQSIITLNA